DPATPACLPRAPRDCWPRRTWCSTTIWSRTRSSSLPIPRHSHATSASAAEQKKIPQAEINALMIQHARAGRSVVRLKSGDPLVFGRAAEEIDALREANVNFEVVPGITAAFAAAAALGLSLTDRRASSSVHF